MKRVLFVDDESRVLDGLRRSLRRHRDEWDCAFAVGGSEAVAVLTAERFDAVVTDMRMPGLDGAELLTIMRERQPGAVRIVLSAHSDGASVVQAAGVAHQFLSKPCGPLELVETLRRATALQTRFDSTALRDVVGGVGALPSAPGLYADVKRLVDRDATLEAIADVVARDVGMTAKLLHLVNSAFFGGPQETSDVRRAVQYLGFNNLKSLVLSHGVFGAFNGKSGIPSAVLEYERHHALTVGAVAHRIVARPAHRDAALMAGMLHDVGKLVLALHAPAAATRLGAPPPCRSVLHRLEREEHGVGHAEIGGYLMGLWRSPWAVIEGVATHHHPATAPPEYRDVALAVHTADALVRDVEADTADMGLEEELCLLDRDALEAAGVADRLPLWREDTAKLMEHIGANVLR